MTTRTAVKVEDKNPLMWAKDWPRTPIGERKTMKAWKKPLTHYREALLEQLRKFGASEVVISFNTGDAARLDPGITVYFSKPRTEDHSWQLVLGIDNPAPTLAEIDAAYRKKALEHHPDRGESPLQ